MSWTETTRLQYRRKGLRYSSDMLDAEWELIAPFVAEDRRLGRPRATVLRAVVEAIFYIATTGCQWRMLPKEFPPYSTVQRYFYRWRDTGPWERINHTLLMPARAAAGREASPKPAPLQNGGRGNRQPVGQNHRGGRPARVRRRQENQRPQAPHHHRYGRPAGRGHRPWRRGSEPAPAQAGDRDGAVPLLASIRCSFPWRPTFCRCRLCRRQARNSAGQARAMDGRDRQASPGHRGLYPVAAALGGRAYHRLAQPQPPAGQRF